VSEAVQFSEADVPTFPRHVRFRFDEARKNWVLLGPERVLMPDEVAVEVLKLCDGEASIGQIVDRLAEAFEAPRDEILPDVLDLFNDLAGKGFVRP
jgi:pyrroloquinoline quinone biosynthesis protein D